MSRNGSGIYNLPAGNPVVTGTTITSSWANTTMQNIADGLTQSVASDGQTPMTGALNMANNKITSVTDPTNAQDAATKNYTDTAITGLSATYLAKASNLSDVANATTSRGNLSAAKSGANSDITSLTGLTTALSAAQGGTGITSPGTSGNVLTSNGTAWTSAAPTAGLTTKRVIATRDMTLASGTQSITGAGFRPTAVIVYNVVQSTNKMSINFADSAGGTAGVKDDSANIADNWTSLNSFADLGSTDEQVATFTSYDADGITINWTKFGSPTGTCYLNILFMK